MSSANRVGAHTPRAFGQFLLASGFVNIAATGNAVSNLPIVSGGITNSGGAWAVRRVQFVNLALGNINAGNVSICGSTDGNQGNTITGNVLLSSLTGNLTFQDATLPSASNTSVFTFQSLSVIVNTANAAGTSVLVRVMGDLLVP